MNENTAGVYPPAAGWGAALQRLPEDLEADRRRIDGRKTVLAAHAKHNRERRAVLPKGSRR